MRSLFNFNNPLYGENFDNCGLILRTNAGLYVCYNRGGKTEIQTYSDFLADKAKIYIKIRFKEKNVGCGSYNNQAELVRERNMLFFERIKE